MKTISISEGEDGGERHELARFTSAEVTRIEITHDSGKRVWILDGPEHRVEDVVQR